MDLVDAMGVDFRAAKRWTTATLSVGAVIYLASLTVVFLLPGADKQLAFLLFLLQVFAFYAQVRADDRYACGEAVRRAAMLQDGLGIQPSTRQILELLARLCLPDTDTPAYLGRYYSSQTAAGPGRMCEILRESAFWTKSLARKAQRIMWCVVAVSTLLAVCAAIACLLWTAHGSRPQVVAEIVLISLGFWSVGDWARLAVRYGVLADSTESLLGSIDKLCSGVINYNDAHIVLGEYNAALARGPVVPKVIYELYKARLNKAWDATYQTLKENKR